MLIVQTLLASAVTDRATARQGTSEVDIEEYGCSANLESASACTVAFREAIGNVSAAGGGTVHVRGPGFYITAAIEMKSAVTLVVHAGASINASTNISDWSTRIVAHPQCAKGRMPAELDHGVLGGLFYASLAENFTIRGPGVVNGAAAAWNNYHAGSALAAKGPPNPLGLIRSNMFVFSQTRNVIIEDLQIQDSSAWTLNPQYSQNISFRRLAITSPSLGSHGHNTDGFDPWACQDVEFRDSSYSGGDDCVAVKSGKNDNETAAGAWPCGDKYASRNIHIDNITCDGSHGLTIGSEMSGGVDGVTFSNIRIINSGPSVRIKSQCGRQSYVRNVLYENIDADEVQNAVWIDMDYFSSATSCPTNEVSEFSNISVRNLTVDRISDHGDVYTIVGLQETAGNTNRAQSMPIAIYNVTLENITVRSFGNPGRCTYADVRTVNVSPPLPRGYGCGGKLPAMCNISANRLCYNDSENRGLGLTFMEDVHDHTTLETLAVACYSAELHIAAVDNGNHPYCGKADALTKHSNLLRPLIECEKVPCFKNKTEYCGAHGRLLVYNFSCG